VDSVIFIYQALDLQHLQEVDLSDQSNLKYAGPSTSQIQTANFNSIRLTIRPLQGWVRQERGIDPRPVDRPKELEGTGLPLG